MINVTKIKLINVTRIKYDSFTLLFEGGFMWGGKRQGAGRKSSEPTKLIRVPESMILEIMELVLKRREQDLKPVTENNLKSVTENNLKSVTENNLKSVTENNQATKALEGLNSRTCKLLRKKFGSLAKAAELGVMAQPDGGFWVPDAIQYYLD
jgi:hypothetical protein